MTPLQFSDGVNDLSIERDPDGRLRFRIDPDGVPGAAVTVSPAREAEIVEFLREAT